MDKDRFFKYIKKTPTCWLWIGAKNRKGYGQFGVKLGFKKWKIKYSHRISYELFVKKIPKNLLVLHKCDTPACVNPDHLFIGTNLDNSNDKIRKGRIADTRGEKNGRAVITRKIANRIRFLYKTGNYSQKELGEKYGIKKSMSNRIITNLAWK